MTAAIVLAAGLSRRMGRPKLLLDLQGKPVIRHTVERVIAAGFAPVLVVVGPEHEALRRALDGLGARLVVNPAPEAGQASSVRVGIQAMPAEARAALIALGDQPGLSLEVISRLRQAMGVSGTSIAAPRYTDGLGNPVLFAAAVFPELLTLSGDRGARSVVEKDAARLAIVDVSTPMPGDLDTPEDYARLNALDNSR